jgi:hypothetical protein
MIYLSQLTQAHVSMLFVGSGNGVEPRLNFFYHLLNLKMIEGHQAHLI